MRSERLQIASYSQGNRQHYFVELEIGRHLSEKMYSLSNVQFDQANKQNERVENCCLIFREYSKFWIIFYGKQCFSANF